MTGHTHSVAEWTAFLSLGVSGWAVMAAAVWLTADAEPADFDPRPAVRAAWETDALAPVRQIAVHAGHDFDRAAATTVRLVSQPLRDAALTVAALLLILTAPSGGTR